MSAEFCDVIQEPADVLGLLLGHMLPADLGWGGEVDVVDGIESVVVGGEFHGR